MDNVVVTELDSLHSDARRRLFEPKEALARLLFVWAVRAINKPERKQMTNCQIGGALCGRAAGAGEKRASRLVSGPASRAPVYRNSSRPLLYISDCGNERETRATRGPPPSLFVVAIFNAPSRLFAPVPGASANLAPTARNEPGSVSIAGATKTRYSRSSINTRYKARALEETMTSAISERVASNNGTRQGSSGC